MKFLAPIVLVAASVVFLTHAIPTMNKQNNETRIARVWRGWTSVANANAFEKILQEIAIPGIEKNKPNGLKGIQFMTLKQEGEIMFTTIMYFESLESVKAFAGDDYTKAHIDPAVAPLLNRYDTIVEHHTLKESKAWD